MMTEWHQQFSVRHLLVVIFVIGAALAWFRDWRVRQSLVPHAVHAEVNRVALDLASKLATQADENEILRRQLDHLRNRIRTLAAGDAESGDIRARVEATDPAAISIRQLPSFAEPLVWRYEINVPEGRSPQVSARLGAVPKGVVVASSTVQRKPPQLSLPSGRTNLEISLTQTEGSWQLNLDTGSRTIHFPLAFEVSFGRSVDLGRQTSRLAANYQDANEVNVVPADQPSEIFRLSTADHTMGEIAGEAGVVVYLQPSAAAP